MIKIIAALDFRDNKNFIPWVNVITDDSLPLREGDDYVNSIDGQSWFLQTFSIMALTGRTRVRVIHII